MHSQSLRLILGHQPFHIRGHLPGLSESAGPAPKRLPVAVMPSTPQLYQIKNTYFSVYFMVLSTSKTGRAGHRYGTCTMPTCDIFIRSRTAILLYSYTAWCFLLQSQGEQATSIVRGTRGRQLGLLQWCSQMLGTRDIIPPATINRPTRSILARALLT